LNGRPGDKADSGFGEAMGFASLNYPAHSFGNEIPALGKRESRAIPPSYPPGARSQFNYPTVARNPGKYVDIGVSTESAFSSTRLICDDISDW
jgi:hypothetical protein